MLHNLQYDLMLLVFTKISTKLTKSDLVHMHVFMDSDEDCNQATKLIVRDFRLINWSARNA